MNEFLNAFGQSADNTNTFVRDQRSLVNDHVNTNNQNQELGKGDAEQSYHLNGKDPQTGEDFSLDIKSDKLKPKNKIEEEWVRREMTVTFTSLNNKDKFISSSIDSLCGGRYAHLIDQPLPIVAATLIPDIGDILRYADSSVASYSDRITPQQAFRIARAVTENFKMSYIDYEKISAKLNREHQYQFNDLLKSSKIKISYPTDLLEKELIAKRAKVEEDKLNKIDSDRRKSISYYVDFIRDFKEYKTKEIPALEKRVASILSVVDQGIRQDVIAELKKDSVTQTII